MEAGARVWVYYPESDDAWILSEVKSRSETELNMFQVSNRSKTFVRPRIRENLDDGSEVNELKYEGVELANNSLSEEEKAEGKDDDMITLPHLHEPAILHAIGGRFDEGKIYTWTGPVLIAVNPFERLALYTEKILEKYRQEGLLRSQGVQTGANKLGPHIYSIADLSYRQMMAPGRKSQAILISGESGAGKTESTKIVMKYLTTLGSSNTGSGDSGEISVMDRVLQSNPILEAFGNAKTLRNDNSSRFGKFIELGFSRSGHLLGAKIQTYLLEKVRIASHASGERNYHIFYQLLRGASEEQKKKYGFHDGDTGGLELSKYYHMTGQGGAPDLREYTDEESMPYTVKAMKNLGWDESKINTVLSLVAGILHLGQVQFVGEEDENGQEISKVENENVLTLAAELLGVNKDKLTTALTLRILMVRGTGTEIKLSPEKSIDARDALGKTIYGALFLWIVSEVNISVIWKKDSDVCSSVGVLDIFGFECFPINSFEQLCINYTNESLQQQFNKFIFKMEQIEYEAEKISWDFIAFPDNQDCLDLIQSKPSGILAMLDDECRLGNRGNDKNWADRLYKQYIPNKGQEESENTRFSATPIMKSRAKFCVRHFAGPVEYTGTTGFLEKNKDEIPVTAQNLLESADSWLINEIYSAQKAETDEASSGKSGKPARQKTVSQQFKDQLSRLMDKVESTQPHYIRCLKPNDAAKPKLLTRKRLTEQLRYGGVLEAVRVARMGFPVRLNHTKFFQEYRMLLPTIPEKKLTWRLDNSAAQKLCVRLVEILLEEGKKDYDAGTRSPHEEGISLSEKIRRMQRQPIPMIFPKTDVQLGSTKVFMRKPAHDALEAHRVFHQTASATILQAWIRGMIKRVQHLIFCDAVETVQRFIRGSIGRERWWRARESAAISLLTNSFRMLIVTRQFRRGKRGIVSLQGVYRGHAERRIQATKKIQTQVRMRNKHIIYRKLKSASIALQCRYRRGIARKILIGLKGEQKDIGKLKQNNEQLKSEMAILKAMLSAQAEGSANKLESEKEIALKQEEINKLEKQIAKLEAELEAERATVKKLEMQIERARTEANNDKEEIRALRQRNKVQELQQSPHSPLRTANVTDVPDSPVREILIPQLKPQPQVTQSTPTQVEDLSKSEVWFTESKPQVTAPQPQAMELQESQAAAPPLQESELLEPQVPAPLLQSTDSSQPQIPAPQPQISASQVSAPQPQATNLSEPKVSAPPPQPTDLSEPQVSVPQPQVSVPQPQVSVPQPQVPVPQPQAPHSQEPQASAPQLAPEKQTYSNEPNHLTAESSSAPNEVPSIQATSKLSVNLQQPEKSEKQVDSAAIAKYRDHIKRLEDSLRKESKARRAADTEVIRVRAELNGISLPDSMLGELTKQNSFRRFSNDGSITSMPSVNETNEMKSPKRRGNKNDSFDQFDKKVDNIVKRIRSPGDFLPIIKRGFSNRSLDVPDLGWKVVVNSRKEREENLRDEVQRFEAKMKNLYTSLQNGGEITMWQLNVQAEVGEQDEFVLKNTQVMVKLQQKGEFLVQAVLVFTMKGGLFANRLKRRSQKNKALDPLSLNEILEVKAGCDGRDPGDFPITGKATKNEDGKQSSCFLTLKAAPTPVASTRLYFLKFKSTSARDDLLMGLRGLLADLQIKEGVNVSSMHHDKNVTIHGKTVLSDEEKDIQIPLSEVHKALDVERAAYDRLLLLMLQGSSDLKDRDKELMGMREKMERIVRESKEKDKVQANDSKLIMQLSKKLETLLMDNEDLREQNDNLNNHLVAMQSERLNYSF